MSNFSLHNRVSGVFHVKTTSPLFIGGKMRETNKLGEETKQQGNKLVLLTSTNKEWAIVPGSSLKGIYRSSVLQILDTIDLPESQVLQESLFGTATPRNSVKGRLIFEDTRIPKKALNVKNMTPVDRIRQTALPLKVDVVNPGTTFDIRWSIDNAQPEEIAFMYLFMRELKQGSIFLGGGSGRGFGQILLEKATARLNLYGSSNSNFDLPEKAGWKQSSNILYSEWTANDTEVCFAWMKEQLVSLREKAGVRN